MSWEFIKYRIRRRAEGAVFALSSYIHSENEDENPEEKLEEFKRDAFGFEDTRLVHYVGAIDLNKMLEVCPIEKKDKEPFVIIKHGKPDERKYVTEKTKNRGSKIHV